ncbi:hypothetical protein F5876DRAFT_78818 [Lentinula aff. lateritia]|uniref:Uncharacterized protein n=1 Tax=Lentinula aff. lateritia TaxID=2804960 RepID=A0ACC1TUC5_9AGAR|nr:hypothetical protein F5876DRAFT_78818 [Lentinula aff. lateritia]
MLTTLFVAGLGPTMRARELGEVFERYGRIARCDIMPSKKGRTRNSNNPGSKMISTLARRYEQQLTVILDTVHFNRYAFVEFLTSRDADDALQSLNQTHLGGYLLKIAWAEHPPNQDGPHAPLSHPSRHHISNRSRSRSPFASRRDVSLEMTRIIPDLHSSSFLEHDQYNNHHSSRRISEITSRNEGTQAHSNYDAIDTERRHRDDERYNHGYEIRSDSNRKRNGDPHERLASSWDSRHYEPQQPQDIFPERRSRNWDPESVPHRERRKEGSRLTDYQYPDTRPVHHKDARTSRSCTPPSARTSRASRYASTRAGDAFLALAAEKFGSASREISEKRSWNESTQELTLGRSRRSSSYSNRPSPVTRTRIPADQTLQSPIPQNMQFTDVDYARTPPGPPPPVEMVDVEADNYAKTPLRETFVNIRAEVHEKQDP